MEYFGTSLFTCGHYFFKLNGDSMEETHLDYKRLPFEAEEMTKGAKRYGETFFHQIKEYSILAIEGSCYDQRPGSHTVFFIKEMLTEAEMIEMVKSIPIAMRIINQIPFNVQL